MAKKTSDPIDVKVRMTRDLHRKIQRDADRQGQTINAEILRRLEVSFKHEKEGFSTADVLAKVHEAMRSAVGTLSHAGEMMGQQRKEYIDFLAKQLDRPTLELARALDQYEKYQREKLAERNAERKVQQSEEGGDK